MKHNGYCSKFQMGKCTKGNNCDHIHHVPSHPGSSKDTRKGNTPANSPKRKNGNVAILVRKNDEDDEFYSCDEGEDQLTESDAAPPPPHTLKLTNTRESPLRTVR